MENSKKEERVELPEGWNSDDNTWIKIDDSKNKKDGKIDDNDIEQKIKKFIKSLKDIDPSKMTGGITNFCFKFPSIVASIFGTQCSTITRSTKSKGLFSKAKPTTINTNPFDYKNFCDAIFSFIDGCFINTEKDAEAKKQNYCLLFEMIFMQPGYIGDISSFSYEGTSKNLENYITKIFNKNEWTHMPIISSRFMEGLCSRIDKNDIKKYNLKFVLDTSKNDQAKEISSYDSIVIKRDGIVLDSNKNETEKQKIEALNKLKLSYYEALLENKFDSNKSKDFFKKISFILTSGDKINFNDQVNKYMESDNSKNKKTPEELKLLIKDIIKSSLTIQDKSCLLYDLLDVINKFDKKISWNVLSAEIDILSESISNSQEVDAFSLSAIFEQVCYTAAKIESKELCQKISHVLNSANCFIDKIRVDTVSSLFEILRGDVKTDPTSNYLNAINSVAKNLAGKAYYATDKLNKLLELVKCEEKKDKNQNSPDQNKNAQNKKEASEKIKNVEIVNKNINSDIFQSLFDAINKCCPLLNEEDKFYRKNLDTRNEFRDTLFENFLKIDKSKDKQAEKTYFDVVAKIMAYDTLSKIKNEGDMRSELEFVIRVIIDGRKKFSADSKKSIVTFEDIERLINTIGKCFPLEKKENANNNRYELVKYLLESLKNQNIDSDAFQLLFNEINTEFPLTSNNKNIAISLEPEELKKRNELLDKLSNVSVIVDSKKNEAAQKQYFDTVNKMMESYKSKFLKENTVNEIIDEGKNKNNKDETKKLLLESLIRMTILGQVKLSPQPTESKVKYKNIIELIDVIEQSFPSDSENDKSNRYDLIKCLFEQFSIVKDFLLPCNKMLDGIKTFAKNNKLEAFSQGISIVKNMFTGQKQIIDFFTPATESVEKTEETKDKISEIKNTQEKPENKSETEKNKKTGNKILSYKEILPTNVIIAVNNYNKALKKDRVNDKFDLDTQVLNDIKKHNVMKKISKLNKIINNDSPDLKNPVIGIFKFLSDKKFNLDQFLSVFQENYLGAVVNLINLGSKVLDQFITKQDVTKETGELFKLENKNKSENDKFNQNLVYNSSLKHINELIISNLIQQGIKKVVENLDKFFVKSFKDENNENDENENLVNEEHRRGISHTVSQKITDVLLKKFGSVYGLISKIQEVTKNVGKNGKYSTTASAIFDFVLDCIDGENNENSNLLSSFLELVDAFNFGNLNIEKDSAKSKKIVYNIINSFMGLIAFSKALDCDTEIFANDKNINNKEKTTGKLIGLLKKIVDTKKFSDFVGKFLNDKYIKKIKQLLDDVDKLKFEDCAYLLCSDEILVQNKENKKENEKSEEKKDENTINVINVINDGNDKNELLDNKNSIEEENEIPMPGLGFSGATNKDKLKFKDLFYLNDDRILSQNYVANLNLVNVNKLLGNKNSIKEENEKESKLDIILNQTAMFSWLRKTEKDKTTFFDLTKSLSDKKKIEEFEKCKKLIKNNQEKEKKSENIAKVNNYNITNSTNNISINNNDNANEININSDIKKKGTENKNDKNDNDTIQLKNVSEIKNNNEKQSVKANEGSNNELEQKGQNEINIENGNGNNIENSQQNIINTTNGTNKIDIKSEDIKKVDDNQNKKEIKTEKQQINENDKNDKDKDKEVKNEIANEDNKNNSINDNLNQNKNGNGNNNSIESDIKMTGNDLEKNREETDIKNVQELRNRITIMKKKKPKKVNFIQNYVDDNKEKNIIKQGINKNNENESDHKNEKKISNVNNGNKDKDESDIKNNDINNEEIGIDNHNPLEKKINNKLNNQDQFNTIRNLFPKNNENKKIDDKKIMKRNNSLTLKHKFLFDEKNEQNIHNQIGTNKNEDKENVVNVNIEENIMGDANDGIKMNIKKEEKQNTENKKNMSEQVIDKNFEKKINDTNNINKHKNGIENNDINNEEIGINNHNLIEKEMNSKSNNQFNAIQNLFHKNNENKKIDNEKIMKKKDSIILEHKFLFDEKNEQNINNQIGTNKNEDEENVVNVNIEENIMGDANDGIKMDIKHENKNQNEEIKEEEEQNNKGNNNKIGNENTVKDKIENEIQNKENNNINNDIDNKHNIQMIIKHKGNDIFKSIGKINFQNKRRSGSFSLKQKSKTLFVPQSENVHDNTSQINAGNVLNQNIKTTKSNRKKKITAAIIFGIICAFSVCILMLALILETLKLLAFIISLSFIGAVTFIITVVLIISIYRTNKVSEPNNVQDNLKREDSLLLNENSKRVERKRVKSVNLSITSRSYGSENETISAGEHNK